MNKKQWQIIGGIVSGVLVLVLGYMINTAINRSNSMMVKSEIIELVDTRIQLKYGPLETRVTAIESVIISIGDIKKDITDIKSDVSYIKGREDGKEEK